MKQIGRFMLLVLGIVFVAVVAAFVPGRHVTAAVNSANSSSTTTPATSPFETTVCTDDAAGATCSSQATNLGFPLPTSFTVPASANGKAVGGLVVDYVSGACVDAGGTYLVTPLSENAVNGVTAAHNFFTGPMISGQTLIQQPTTISVDPGAEVTLHVVDWTATTGLCFLQVNGNLVE